MGTHLMRIWTELMRMGWRCEQTHGHWGGGGDKFLFSTGTGNLSHKLVGFQCLKEAVHLTK